MRHLKVGLLLVVCAFFANESFGCAQTIDYTKGPAALSNTRGVVFDVQWKDCTGIANVQAIVKKGAMVVAFDTFKTTDASASKTNWQIQLPGLNKGDVVSVQVIVFDGTGKNLAQTKAVLVTLN